MIESAVSSNRIEGVTVDQARVKTIVLGKAHLKDRDEEEVRGYRNALKLVYEQGAKLPVSGETVLRLHKLAKGNIWDAGKYKEKPSDIIEKYPDGTSRVRFKTVSPAPGRGRTGGKEVMSLKEGNKEGNVHSQRYAENKPSNEKTNKPSGQQTAFSQKTNIDGRKSRMSLEI